MNRPDIDADEIRLAIDETSESLYKRLDQKGWGSASSIHEVNGILDEEVREFKDSVHDNDKIQQKKELLDIALFAIFSIACINQNSMDW